MLKKLNNLLSCKVEEEARKEGEARKAAELAKFERLENLLIAQHEADITKEKKRQRDGQNAVAAEAQKKRNEDKLINLEKLILAQEDEQFKREAAVEAARRAAADAVDAEAKKIAEKKKAAAEAAVLFLDAANKTRDEAEKKAAAAAEAEETKKGHGNALAEVKAAEEEAAKLKPSDAPKATDASQNCEQPHGSAPDFASLSEGSSGKHLIISDGIIDTLCECSSRLQASEVFVEGCYLEESAILLPDNWEQIREELPDYYKWDIEYEDTNSTFVGRTGYWTCMPLQDDEPKQIPLSIAKAPVVLPVQYQWPPMGGVNPPPDPRPSDHIDCRAPLSLGAIRDIFRTFEDCIGFYVLINGLLQIIVPSAFDTVWASSHLPHKFGGLKVCYIEKTMEATTLSSKVKTTRTDSLLHSQSSRLSSLFRSSRLSQSLELNAFIEARTGSASRERFSGRIGLKVASKEGEPYLLMSSHVITEAITNKSFLGMSRDVIKRLRDDWNEHVEIWAGNTKVSTFAPNLVKRSC